MNCLLSLNFWVGVFSILAGAGIIMAVLGTATETAWATTTGLVLISPIVLMSILLVVVGFPILIVANRRHDRHTRHDCNDSNDNVQPM